VVRRGEVYWLELPEEGRRPVCVLTREEAIPTLTNIVVALVTHTIRDIPTEVKLTTDDGMPSECVISLDNLRTVPRALLTGRVTTLSPERTNEVCSALDYATGC
jgi:mRNA interferase MazF